MVTEESNLSCSPTGNPTSSASELRLQKKPSPKDAELVDPRPDVVLLDPRNALSSDCKRTPCLTFFAVVSPSSSPRTAGVLEPQNCGVPPRSTRRVRSGTKCDVRHACSSEGCGGRKGPAGPF